ncbi:hypothetical protein ZHAS_00009515 [Anopheles sinensis]|uniref:Uncharacterized protein n=1 Tax=Anopheles sinensis TaxID=74873 RepID=A0A084VVF5_ANOSI|nr:hypothetical protein ZHAS_00009515 [Anopheles sinensis]
MAGRDCARPERNVQGSLKDSTLDSRVMPLIAVDDSLRCSPRKRRERFSG